MLLIVLLLVSKAGAMCVGGPQELRRGEVMVMCPLSEDVRLSRRSVVISHFSSHDQRIPDTMLGCVWLERDSQKPDCRTRFHMTLTSLQKDCVVAMVPRGQLHKDGFYQCQLVPAPDADHAFSRCLVFDNDDTDDPTAILSPVIPATDQPLAGEPMEKVLTDDHPGDNSDLVAGLTSAGVILLVLNVVFVAVMIVRHRRHRRRPPTSNTSLESNKQPRRTVPQTSEPSLETEQQTRRTVPLTSEPSLEMESVRMEQRLAKSFHVLEQQSSKGRQRTSWIEKSSKGERQTSETSLEMELQPLSATPKRGRSRELPSPKEVTGKQFRWEVPKRTSLTATKALLKTGQDKRLPVTMVA